MEEDRAEEGGEAFLNKLCQVRASLWEINVPTFAKRIESSRIDDANIYAVRIDESGIFLALTHLRLSREILGELTEEVWVGEPVQVLCDSLSLLYVRYWYVRYDFDKCRHLLR